MTTCCTVVIGHVDHGKTALVRRLTGIDTDRLPEEKARGLSIKPGFAHHGYAGGMMDFVDAPGHEDFIQALICGASGARAALVVISAVEGIGAQTLEHLTIAGALGITRGVIAVSKSDALPPSDTDARLLEIRQALGQTTLADAKLVLCSALTGDGIAQLHLALEALLADAPDCAAPSHSFLPVDRVFTMPGRGTIVTGTLLGGDLQTGDAARMHPGGHRVTIRGLHSRGIARDVIHAGERVAANLRGLGVQDVSRGAVLCLGHGTIASTIMDIRLETLASATKPLKHMDRVRVMFGTTSEVAQLRLFGAGRLNRAQAGFAQLRFQRPVTGFAGQRAIIRYLSPAQTIAGAVLLDPQAGTTGSGDKSRLAFLEAAHSGEAAAIARALCAAQGGAASLSDIARLSRMTVAGAGQTLGAEFCEIGEGRVAPVEDIETCKAAVLAAVAGYHARYPIRIAAGHHLVERAGTAADLVPHVLTLLIASGELREHQMGFAARDHDPLANLSEDQRHRLAQIECRYRKAGLAPLDPEPNGPDPLDQDLTALLLDSATLVVLQNVSLKQTITLHAETLAAAAMTLGRAFPAPAYFTTGEARVALSTSRKVIVPILEYFDARGLTQRSGDMRQMREANSISPPAATC